MFSKDRYDNLIAELNKIGLKLRTDSRLCKSYIEGYLGEDWTVERIAHECALVNWLYNYTPYQGMLRHATAYHSPAFKNKRDLSVFMRFTIQPLIKTDIINAHGGIPPSWPWIKDEPKST